MRHDRLSCELRFPSASLQASLSQYRNLLLLNVGREGSLCGSSLSAAKHKRDQDVLPACPTLCVGGLRQQRQFEWLDALLTNLVPRQW